MQFIFEAWYNFVTYGNPKLSVFSGPVPGTKQPRQKNFKKREKLRRRFAHLDE